MKKKILVTAALVCLLAYAPQPVHAAGADVILKFADAIARTPAAAAKICRKGDAASGTFSARSFGGSLCNDPVVAAWVLSNCYEAATDFAGSQCDGIAQKTLDKIRMMDRSGMTYGSENPQMALIQQVNKLSGSIRATLCRNASNGGGFLAKACSTSPSSMPGMSTHNGGGEGMPGHYGDTRGAMSNPPMNNSGRYSDANSGYNSGRNSNIPPAPSGPAYKTGSKNSTANSGGITPQQLKDGKKNLKGPLDQHSNDENPDWKYSGAYVRKK